MLGLCVTKQLKKIFKAYYLKLKNENPPFSHSLSYIAKKGDYYFQFREEQKNFIDEVEPLNIEARYPSYKERLLKSLTHSKCEEILLNTKNIQQWIKEKL